MDSVKWLWDLASTLSELGRWDLTVIQLHKIADELAAARAEIERLADAVLANQVMIQAREAEIERLEARVPMVCRTCSGIGGVQEIEDGITWSERCPTCRGTGVVWKEANDE